MNSDKAFTPEFIDEANRFIENIRDSIATLGMVCKHNWKDDNGDDHFEYLSSDDIRLILNDYPNGIPNCFEIYFAQPIITK